MVPVYRPTIIAFLFTIFIALLLKSASSQEQGSLNTTYLHSNCSGDGQFVNGSEYQTNLHYLLSNLTSNSGSQKFHNFTAGEIPNKVYGLYLCFFSIGTQLCQRCVQTAADTLLQICASSVEAIVWYDMCLLRYANRSIFSINDVSKYHLYLKGPAEYGQYNQQVSHRLIRLFDIATSGCSPLVSATNVGLVEGNISLHLQVECTPDLSKSDCRSCLRTALARFDTQGHEFAALLQPSCGLASGFADLAFLPPADAVPNKKLYIGMAVTSGIATIVLISNVVLIICLKKKKTTSNKPTGLEEMESMENLHIQLDAIKTATDNFSDDNKLGQGGFGVVYMGKLGDGQAVAVKRLSNASRQGFKEFKTEACLAAKLQHNNLVKVYGFCLESDEMLLVYEFVPNKSLDRLLFDAQRRAHLKWETRCKIIVGIARGLLYLHEGSSPKIIHRDLKPSNILLDGEMNPKIADFGMAKLFGEDQSHENTRRLAGTFGYMAPEYVASGHISIKSDVFSYGVILLEIISGMENRCSDLDAQEGNLLSYAWKLWNEGKRLEFVDTTLENYFSTIDIERCMHIGLLCTQEDPSKRPNMESVLIMLNTDLNIELLPPTSPPVFPYKHETTPIFQGSIGIAVEDVITDLSPRRVQLKWETRCKIIVGITHGLLYLHEDTNPKIIHQDLKSSNILLNGKMDRKIAGFGMAKLFGDQSQGDISRIAGTMINL
ncbi:Cysteine-rich receptor-like protein kinase 19 [Bienertia sinuspersici]